MNQHSQNKIINNTGGYVDKLKQWKYTAEYRMFAQHTIMLSTEELCSKPSVINTVS